MAAVRTYGIPRVIETSEIFLFNGGEGKIRINFTGGIPDDKYQIPATYSTANEFEQLVIESSSQFGTRVFRYGPDGRILAAEPLAKTIEKASVKPTRGRPASSTKPAQRPVADDTKVYENVETIGEATEILLDLGAKADELNGQESVVSAMMRMKVAFPNLKFN